MKFTAFVLSAFCLTTNYAFAAASVSGAAPYAQPFLQVTSDAVSGQAEVAVLLDAQQNAVGFEYVSNGKTQTFDLSGLPAGLVLMQHSGYNAITVKSAAFDPAQGGDIDFIVLTSALSGSYQTIPLELVHNATQWQLFTISAQGAYQYVTQAFVKGNTFFGQLIGIESVTFH